MMDILHRRHTGEGTQLVEQQERKKETLLQQLQHGTGQQQTHLLVKDGVPRRSNACRPLSFSKRSLNASRQSFASELPECEINKVPSQTLYMHSLAYLSMGSLLYALLACYVLNTFLSMQDSMKSSSPVYHGSNNDIENQDLKNESLRPYSLQSSGHFKLVKTGIALSCYMIAACLSCFLICLMQNVLASRISRLHEGNERVVKYLADCSVSRVLAITGFLSCVPVSFIAAAIILILRGSEVGGDNVVGVVFVSLGAGLSLMGGAHCCYHWKEENHRAQNGLPVYDSQLSVPSNLASYAAAPCQNMV